MTPPAHTYHDTGVEAVLRRVFGEDENDEFPCPVLDDVDMRCELVRDHAGDHQFPPRCHPIP